MCVCVCVCVCVHIYIYVHTYVCKYICTHVYVCVYMYVCVCVCVCIVGVGAGRRLCNTSARENLHTHIQHTPASEDREGGRGAENGVNRGGRARARGTGGREGE